MPDPKFPFSAETLKGDTREARDVLGKAIMTTTERETRIEKALHGDRDALSWARTEFPKAVSEATSDVIRKSVGSAELDALAFQDPSGRMSPEERAVLLASNREPGLAEAYREAICRGIGGIA